MQFHEFAVLPPGNLDYGSRCLMGERHISFGNGGAQLSSSTQGLEYFKELGFLGRVCERYIRMNCISSSRIYFDLPLLFVPFGSAFGVISAQYSLSAAELALDCQ